ncbi:MAG: CDP-diacylglycerol--glycerol-3-phosphate 3-phosphatidyltransferase [Syntrophorhabdaceae bacterium PtaU1.Bin034]|jgi:CDP-diacylglycerol--glycerol-3-phosphate 3-phosphatidyltransferase|nr:MAG: CDP-diacylglycerol--glycerol-3-phosphate 3-phosphatidyltransferase [Syntrophorhabdaceae bacterium PtaU1.Bin034]
MKSGDEKTSVWTLPNRLSFIRILFIPAIIYLISTQQKQFLFASCILFIVAGITDGLDGLIARRMSMKSRLGLYLDPIADKLLISSVLITLSCYGFVPLWVTIVMVSREFLINGLRSFYAVEGITIYPSFSGKLKTTLQIVGISCVLFGQPLQQAGLIIIYGALFFSLFSAYKYIYAIFKAEKAQ